MLEFLQYLITKVVAIGTALLMFLGLGNSAEVFLTPFKKVQGIAKEKLQDLRNINFQEILFDSTTSTQGTPKIGRSKEINNQEKETNKLLDEKLKNENKKMRIHKIVYQSGYGDDVIAYVTLWSKRKDIEKKNIDLYKQEKKLRATHIKMIEKNTNFRCVNDFEFDDKIFEHGTNLNRKTRTRFK